MVQWLWSNYYGAFMINLSSNNDHLSRFNVVSFLSLIFAYLLFSIRAESRCEKNKNAKRYFKKKIIYLLSTHTVLLWYWIQMFYYINLLWITWFKLILLVSSHELCYKRKINLNVITFLVVKCKRKFKSPKFFSIIMIFFILLLFHCQTSFEIQCLI